MIRYYKINMILWELKVMLLPRCQPISIYHSSSSQHPCRPGAAMVLSGHIVSTHNWWLATVNQLPLETWHQTQWELSSSSMKSYKNSVYSNCGFVGPIRSQFFTCHDSSAVMTCAKLWPDLTIKFQMKWKIDYHKILIMSSSNPLRNRSLVEGCSKEICSKFISNSILAKYSFIVTFLLVNDHFEM